MVRLVSRATSRPESPNDPPDTLGAHESRASTAQQTHAARGPCGRLRVAPVQRDAARNADHELLPAGTATNVPAGRTPDRTVRGRCGLRSRRFVGMIGSGLRAKPVRRLRANPFRNIGDNLSYPLEAPRFERLDAFQRHARASFQEAGLDVQTVRLATQPFPMLLRDNGAADVAPFAQALETLCRAHGIDYCAIGPVVATKPGADLSYIEAIPDAVGETELTFASVLVASEELGINLEAISRAAEAIDRTARSTPRGFGNLRLAVLANCGPGSPFFPAAYHQGARTRFSIAVEAADLAVQAFSQAESLDEAHSNLRAAIEASAEVIEDVCRVLECEPGFEFGGTDFSLAPFPESERSVGRAIESLGVDAFGCNGTLFAVSLLKRAIEEAAFAHCGFSGVMLPVLEDRILAERSAQNLFTLDSLLLYSTVCGTGLDTVPLPGDVTVGELSAILLDLATLSVVVRKPLTARFMPIPGKKAGDVTDFDFSYFGNAQIMDVRGGAAARIFEANTFLKP